jgi:hypothetical protein
VEVTSLEVIVELSLGRARVIPDVRFWIDRGFAGDLRSETELRLERTRRWRWTGTLVVDEPRSFFYRMGLSAIEGVAWRLRIHDPALGQDILIDEDRITTAKCWLLGSCELPSARRSAGRDPFARGGFVACGRRPDSNIADVQTSADPRGRCGAVEAQSSTDRPWPEPAKLIVLAQHRPTSRS